MDVVCAHGDDGDAFSGLDDLSRGGRPSGLVRQGSADGGLVQAERRIGSSDFQTDLVLSDFRAFLDRPHLPVSLRGHLGEDRLHLERTAEHCRAGYGELH